MTEPINRFTVPATGGEFHPLLAAVEPYAEGKYLHSPLSNFWPCKIKMEGVVYPSVEHAYQAAKVLDNDRERNRLAALELAGAAKREGRKVACRPDWDNVKLGVMGVLCLQKFTIHEDCRELLLMTGDAELREGNDWKDTYWGLVFQQGEWRGQNNLGKTLMGIREVLLRMSGAGVPSLPV